MIEENGGVVLYALFGNNTINGYDELGLSITATAWTSIDRLRQKKENELKCVKCKYIIIYSNTNDGKFAPDADVKELKIKLEALDNKRCKSEIIATTDDAVNNWKKLLNETTCICGLFYVGHGGEGFLFLNGKGENISVKEGAEARIIKLPNGNMIKQYFNKPRIGGYSNPFQVSFVETLPKQNILPGAEISLFGCNTSAGRNIAKSFANYFGVPTLGSQKKLNFDGGTPYTPWYKGGNSFTIDFPVNNTSNTIPEECKCR